MLGIILPAIRGEHIFEKRTRNENLTRISGFQSPKRVLGDDQFVKLQNTIAFLNLVQQPYVLGSPGPQRIGISLELDFVPQLLASRIQSKFDAMKVFTTFMLAAKNKLGAQLLLPHEKISWGFAPTYFS